MRFKQTTYSKDFSNFYDIYASSDFPKVTQLVNTLLDTYNPRGTLLLEVGCGTGMILGGLPKRYTFSGLDISKHMLDIAKKKFPTNKFYLADMSDFSLNNQFDAIICFSDSINHIPVFSGWEKTFKNAYDHLKKDGIFIFDMNTLVRFERLSTMPRYVSPLLDDQFFTVKVSPLREPLYNFSTQIFTLHGKSISVSEGNIPESSFPIERVKQSLEKLFTIKKMIDVIRPRVSKKTGKIVFVCQKKADR